MDTEPLRLSPLRNGVSAVAIVLLCVLILAGIARLTWVFVLASPIELFVLGYFGVTLKRWWAKALCWLAFVGVVVFVGLIVWLVTHITF